MSLKSEITISLHLCKDIMAFHLTSYVGVPFFFFLFSVQTALISGCSGSFDNSVHVKVPKDGEFYRVKRIGFSGLGH